MGMAILLHMKRYPNINFPKNPKAIDLALRAFYNDNKK